MNIFTIVETNSCTDEFIAVRGVYSTEERAQIEVEELELQDRRFVQENFCDLSRFYIETNELDKEAVDL